MSPRHLGASAIVFPTPTLVESTLTEPYLTLVESPKRVITDRQREVLAAGREKRTLRLVQRDSEIITERLGQFEGLLRLFTHEGRLVKPSKKAKAVGAKKAPKPFIVGIDLAIRGIEVRKLFYAAFARGLVKDGYDPEDCLQEVYKGLLTRNNGTCPFDSRKSSFGHYVHIVTRCVLANYIRKEKRKLQFESTECSLGGGSSETGFSIEGCSDKRGTGIDAGAVSALSRTLGYAGPVEGALQLLVEGYSRREVVSRLGVESKWLDGVLASARVALTA